MIGADGSVALTSIPAGSSPPASPGAGPGPRTRCGRGSGSPRASPARPRARSAPIPAGTSTPRTGGSGWPSQHRRPEMAGTCFASAASPPSARCSSTASGCSSPSRCGAPTSSTSRRRLSRRERARHRLPGAQAPARAPAAAGRALADAGGRPREPALVSHDDVRPLARVRPGPGGRRSLATGGAGPRPPARSVRAADPPLAAGRRDGRGRGEPDPAGGRARGRGRGGRWASARAPLVPDGTGRFAGALRIPAVERWWPHTHGAPALHALSVVVNGDVRAQRRVGFRSLGWAPDIRRDGLDLSVNGVPVFARGAVWTPTELVGLAPEPGGAPAPARAGARRRHEHAAGRRHRRL